jgi:PAS domain S-box-containing protein
MQKPLDNPSRGPMRNHKFSPSTHIKTIIAHLDSNLPSTLGNLAIFELVFFFAYKYAMNLSQRNGAPFWLPDSVLLSALLLSRPRKWWIYIVAPLPIRLLVAASPSTPMWFLLAAFANDSLKALVAAGLVRKALPGRGIRFDYLHDFWIYLAATAVLAPALSGVAGAASWVALGREFWPSWRNWFLGDALANIAFTPLLLCLAGDWRKLMAAKPWRYMEGLAIFSGLAFSLQAAHRPGLDNPSLADLYRYIPASLSVWAAVRFGPPGAAACLSIMSMLSVAAMEANPSAFFASPAMDSVLSTQLFMLVLAIPIMSLSVLVEQQRRTERSLRDSEERFRAVADDAPAMIWTAGLDSLCDYFNKTWMKFTGRTLEQELGKGWAESVHPQDLEGCIQNYTAFFQTRRPFTLEYRVRRNDGQYRWLLDSAVPRFSPQGQFAGMSVTASTSRSAKR